MNNLTPNQLKAVKFKDGVCLVVAVPGSGKTRTMMERIVTLVNDYEVAPENILGLTFAKSAAEEMKSRLEDLLGEKSARVKLSTIHSFCFYILKREGKTFEILSGKKQIQFIQKIMKDLDIKNVSVGAVLREISFAKSNMIPVDEFRVYFKDDKTMMRIADIYEIYDRLKKEEMFYDFEDLLVETYHLLKDDESVKEKYQETYKSILIDEFQDVSVIQLETLKLLINDKSSNFWCCGDDHQSIYGFAGVSVRNILDFNDMFPGSEQFILDLNFRSTQKIVQACSNLAQHCTNQIHKDFKTNNAVGEDVIVLESSNERTESITLVNEIRDLVERRGYRYNEIAVLYRANFQSLYPEEAFLQHKIPFYIQGGQNFYSRREVKYLLDYLKIINAPGSDEADDSLMNILNVPVRYISNAIKSELKDFCRKENIHLYQGLKTANLGSAFVRKHIRKFISFMDPLIESADTVRPSELLKILRDGLDYDRFILDQDLPAIDDVIIENLNQLELSAARYKNIGSFLDYTDTFEDTTVCEDKDGVQMLSIHKSKGLEFRAVFVIGMVENLLPSAKSQIDEERRVCFVAISRAMELLFLSYPVTYLNQPSKKSIFIDEILGNHSSESE